MTAARRDLFDLFRPWLDSKGYTRERIVAVDAFCDRVGLPANDNAPVPIKPVAPPPGPISPAIAMIDARLLRIACPENTLAELALWAEPLRNACLMWGIDTMREVASFSPTSAWRAPG